MRNQMKALGLIFFSMCLNIFTGYYPSGGVSLFFFGEPEFPYQDVE